MCGIAGFLKLRNQNKVSIDDLKKMISKLSHRGPDFEDCWQENNVYLAHSRLSIIDISKKGHQPMASHSGRYVITFNGEIYNFNLMKIKLQKEKRNIKWRGTSDTEVFLECIEHWGFEKALKMSRGMFAFSVWDKKNKNLTIARDRIGEKPLYYGKIDEKFVFSSELKSIKSVFKSNLTYSKNAMNMMLRYGYISAPLTIYKEVFKLQPGFLLTINKTGQYIKSTNWFNFASEVKKSKSNFKQYNEKKLHEILRIAVKEQMVSDVPIGCLLSGGVDSSLITSIMQEHSKNKINTFTIGFSDDHYNEATYAKKISKILNTQHHELYVKPKMAIDLISKLPKIYDEPFGDSSKIPTILVSQLASKNVKVCLSGDGGDELFGGYNRYIWSNIIFKLFKNSVYLKSLFSNLLSKISTDNWNEFYKIFSLLISQRFRVNNFGDKIHKISEVINFKSEEDLYIKLISQWRSDLPTNHNFNEILSFQKKLNWNKNVNFIENMMISDTLNYLPDDILVKVDRASMSTSLETRAPFLDIRVIKEAWGIPLNEKIKKKSGKLPLKNILSKYLPSELIDRPKQGFGVPIDTWLRTSLKDWAEDLLDQKKIENGLYFDSKAVRKIWQDHLTGKRNWQYPLWNILMLQSWIEDQN